MQHKITGLYHATNLSRFLQRERGRCNLGQKNYNNKYTVQLIDNALIQLYPGVKTMQQYPAFMIIFVKK